MFTSLNPSSRVITHQRHRDEDKTQIRRAIIASASSSSTSTSKSKPIPPKKTYSQTQTQTRNVFGFQVTPTQSAAFTLGATLGLPWALYVIARDVRRQNIAERKRAMMESGKARAANALDGKREGRLRASEDVFEFESRGKTASSGGGAGRADVRRTRNNTDVPLFSNRGSTGVTSEGAVNKPKRAPSRSERERDANGARKPARVPAAAAPAAAAPVRLKKGPPVKVTLAVQCLMPEGSTLCVVGDDAAIKQPRDMQRVGADRWQLVLELGQGELRYMYLAKKGDNTLIKAEEGERVRKISADDNPLVIEKTAPKF
jgi:hypothetical protein